MSTKISSLILVVLLTKNLQGQNSFLLMGARSTGVGNASSTLADEWSIFNNIAGLAKVTNTAAAFAYDARPALIGANRMAASFSIPSKIGAWGLGIFRFGDDLYSEQIVSCGFGNQIGNTSLGVKTNYIQYRAEGFGINSAIAIDFGGITHISKQISIGAYITNLNQSQINGERLPTKLVAGVGLSPTDKILIATEIEKDVAYQATWRTGLEYSIQKKIFFRTGFNLNPNAGYAGLGAHKKNLKFDYAIRFSQLAGVAHNASAVYLIHSKSKK